jgi:RNA polymerase sigma factor (sigma-70 family)
MNMQVEVAAQDGVAMDEARKPSGLLTVTDRAQTRARRGQIHHTDFAHIYDLYRRKVYLWCLRIARNPEDAEDLTQDAFLLLFRKIDTYRGEAAFSTWLYRLTMNTALMRLRKKQSPQSSLEEILESHDFRDCPRRLGSRLRANAARLQDSFLSARLRRQLP